MEKMGDYYHDRSIFNYTELPSTKTSDAAVEPYNCVLGMQHHVEHSDVTMCLDNEALYGLCNRNLKIQSPTYSDINYLIAVAMSGVTCSFRYTSQVNTD
jgi:tubulin beta